jgi:hypothetical protein
MIACERIAPRNQLRRRAAERDMTPNSLDVFRGRVEETGPSSTPESESVSNGSAMRALEPAAAERIRLAGALDLVERAASAIARLQTRSDR